MNSDFLIMSMYERNHNKKWWDLDKSERTSYAKKNMARAKMQYYKDTGFVRLQLICSAKQKTKFGSNENRISHFEEYLRNQGFKCITFPYSTKSIQDTTFCVDIPYEKYKDFLVVLKYYEISERIML